VRSIRLFVVVLCFTGVGLLTAAPRAFAANSLQSSQPADGSTVSAPDKIQFFFTENTDATQLRVLLEGPSGAVDIGVPAADDENTISVALPQLSPGSYSTSWRVGAAGGLSSAIRLQLTAAATTTTPAETTVAVTTTVAPATSATSTPTASTTASSTTVVNGTSPAQALARFVATAAALVLVGAFLVLLLAWPAGLDDPLAPPLLRVLAGVAVIGTLAVIVLAPDGASALGSLSGRHGGSSRAARDRRRAVVPARPGRRSRPS
jgi:methionine-rich copper-binding protein CopC